MAKGRESFDRRQRERAKKAKADAKRERRQSRDTDTVDEEPEAPSAPPADEEAVIAALGRLHAAYDDGKIGFDAFEEQRAELLGRLQVD